MKFIETTTLDWYDNVLKSFCTDDDGVIYYCWLLALNHVTNDKIYLCAELKYLKGGSLLKQMIKSGIFKSGEPMDEDAWDELSLLISLKPKNETFLIKTKNLLTDEIQLLKYRDNCRCHKKIIWADIQVLWETRERQDNWMVYDEYADVLNISAHQ